MRSFWVPILTVLSACQTLTPASNSNQPSEPQRVPSVFDTAVEFVGPRGSSTNIREVHEIRIGLFAPTSPEHPVGLAMFEGAGLAIDLINSSGGLEGVPLRLVCRWDDDPWRGGSKEMIKLVYEDSVWAVIGSVDGAATHVAEQVITKAWLPLLSPVSADPTLTYIRIPWMFRLPPDDGKQAAVIVSDGIEANSLSSVGLITSTDHDGRVFAEEMSEQMASAQSPPVFHLEVSLENPDLEMTAARAGSFGSDGIIVRLPVEKVLAFLEAVESEGYRSPILIPWIPGLLPADLGERYTGDIHYVVPFSETDNGAYDVFVNEYSERFGRSPLPSAAYTFDALNILMRSIEQTGQVDLSRAGLRDAIAGASGYVGVTGPVSWDNAGGNEAEPTLRLLAGRGMTN